MAIILVFAVAIAAIDLGRARGDPPAANKAEARDLAAIKKKLSFKENKATTWYVIQLKEAEVSLTGSSVRVKSSVRLVKVQRQDAAAERIHAFMQVQSAGRKVYVSHSFADTGRGRTLADEWLAKLNALAQRQGYR